MRCKKFINEFFASVCVLLLLGFSTSAQAARDWKKISIPGAVCGDGQPYHIFYSAGDPHQLAFDLMGGGACWDALTCYALPDTFVHPIPFVVEPSGFVSDRKEDSPVYAASLVYFPYCTADIHLGKHVAQYGPVRVHHEGSLNFEKTITHLQQVGVIKWNQVRQFVLMGYSAGALGALVHSMMLDRLLPETADRVLIADAPGLHYGNDFSRKFTADQIRDFNEALSPVGVTIDSGNGNLASAVVKLCEHLPRWRIGVLQGSRDIVMSLGFSNISPQGEEELIYGAQGLYSLTSAPRDNCAMWAPVTYQHTFLMSNYLASTTSSDGVSAMDFVSRLVNAGRIRSTPNAGPNSR